MTETNPTELVERQAPAMNNDELREVRLRVKLTKQQARKLGRVSRWEQETAFGLWIDALTEDVIEGEYGYEPGEFTVFPDQWRAMWKEGLTPQQAFRRALDAFAEQRADDDREQKENWARIQAEDAAIRARSPLIRESTKGDRDDEHR